MPSQRTWPLLLAAAVACVAPAAGQSRADRIERTHQVFAEWNRPGSPGCAVGIVRDGKLIFDRGYGRANLDDDIPITSESVFYIASTSKQFTAASIALLALQGKLSLDDEVRKYIPELPAYDNPVTIRQLVHHTSGVRDYLALRSIAGRSFEDFFDMPWAVELIARQEQLNFTPGSEFLYSNSGYLLLAEIVGRVSGKPLPEFGKENFFEPLGMDATHWGGDRHRVVPHRVISYDREDDGSWRRYLKNFHAMGDGNLLTSVEDLVTWDRMFYDTTDAWRPLVQLMHTRGVLNNGDTLNYAFGLFTGEYRDHRTIAHGGAFLGFRTELLRFPEDRFSAIVLCNFGSANPSSYAQRLADIWLFGDAETVAGEAPAPPADDEPRIELPRSAMTSFPGVYRNPESPVGDIVVTLGATDLTLEAAGATFLLAPTAPDRFRSVSGPVTLRVRFETEGDRRLLRVTPPSGDEMVLTGSDLPSYASGEFNGFAGRYYSRELDATYLVSAHDGQLYVTPNTNEETALRPVGKDEFTMAGWTLTFSRADATIDGFALDAGRVRGLRFVRQ